ncbi:MAG: flavin reductase, partial [Microvirga sp.]
MLRKAPRHDPSPDPSRFREGMSRVAGAVHLVTTDGPAGRAGFTATAVTPVTDDPPS